MNEKQKTIVWVDPDYESVEHYIRYLQNRDYIIKHCTSLSEGEAAINENSFQLLILDVMIAPTKEEEIDRYLSSETEMGVQSGLVFYKRTKEIIGNKNIKLLVFTQRIDAMILERFQKEGLDISKFARKTDYTEVRPFYELVQNILGG